MTGCHHNLIAENILTLDSMSLIWLLFITGIAGSLSHCIGMCGPIAMAQLNVKLMRLPPGKLKETEKLKIALLLPYYFGKATTYTLLAIIAYLFSTALSDIHFIHYLGAILLALTAIFFIISAFSNTRAFTHLLDSSITRKFQLLLANKTRHLYLQPYGIKGYTLGMVLGLLPCGLVYAAVVTAISSANNIFSMALAVFAFGLATVPGLYISAYAGTMVLRKSSKMFTIFYTAIMLLNAGLLLYYAFKQLRLAGFAS
jgi:hypothetical protein